MIVGEDYNFHNSAMGRSTILEAITNNHLLEDTSFQTLRNMELS